MAKESKTNKSQIVRDYLAVHPDAMPKDVRAALAKKGIEVSRVLVSTIKGKLNTLHTVEKAAKKHGAVETAAAAVIEKPTTSGGTITLDQVKKVAQTVATLGGFQRVTEVLEVIKELGGVKKFRDLAEAMSATAYLTDDIPF